MIIMGVDPALTEIGVVVYDTEKNSILVSKTICTIEKRKFVSDLYNKKEIQIKKVERNTDNNLKKEIQYRWNAFRLKEIYYNLLEINALLKEKDINIDLVICEGALKTDVANCVGIVNFVSTLFNSSMFEYYPKSWKKTLTGNGNIDENSLTTFVHNMFNKFHLTKFMSEHEIDSLGIILAHIKALKIPNKFRNLVEFNNNSNNLYYSELLVEEGIDNE